MNYAVHRYGNAEQHDRLFAYMTTGPIGAYARSEPGSGSDAFGLSTRADKRDGG